MGKFAAHKSKWRDCELCELCETRSNVVLARGKLPCEVLFIGEAPGKSEDALGQPFVGPAGKLLDQIIERSYDLCDREYRWAVTNLVACIPRNPETYDKIEEPHKEHIKACRDRLMEFVKIANPKLICCLGKLAAKYKPNGYKTVELTHPAAILRMNIAAQPLEVQKAYVKLSDAI